MSNLWLKDWSPLFNLKNDILEILVLGVATHRNTYSESSENTKFCFFGCRKCYYKNLFLAHLGTKVSRVSLPFLFFLLFYIFIFKYLRLHFTHSLWKTFVPLEVFIPPGNLAAIQASFSSSQCKPGMHVLKTEHSEVAFICWNLLKPHIVDFLAFTLFIVPKKQHNIKWKPDRTGGVCSGFSIGAQHFLMTWQREEMDEEMIHHSRATPGESAPWRRGGALRPGRSCDRLFLKLHGPSRRALC